MVEVHLGTDTYVGDRGEVSLPTWILRFVGLGMNEYNQVTVLAVAPPAYMLQPSWFNLATTRMVVSRSLPMVAS